MNEIVLKQAPVIGHQLAKIGAEVDAKIAELNLDKLIANEDTVKYLKTVRAELNKTFNSYEEERKALDRVYSAPMVEFKSAYKIHITDKILPAVAKLSDSIGKVETKVKDAKKEAVMVYFDELCAASKIDFLKFENTGLEINLSTSEKKYKEQCNDFVQRVTDDLSLIASDDNEAEILVEYKKTLNASAAITTVRARIEEKKAEDERIRQRNISNRKIALSGLGCQFYEFSKTYQYNDRLFVPLSDVENLNKDDFTAKLQALKVDIENDKAEAEELRQKEQAVAKANEPQNEPEKQGRKYNVAYVAEAPKTAPLTAPISAPVEVKEEETVTASFKVVTIMPVLEALGQYMRENGIKYESI